MKNSYKREKIIILISAVISTVLNIIPVIVFFGKINLTRYSFIPFISMIIHILIAVVAILEKRDPLKAHYAMFLSYDKYQPFSHFTPEYAGKFYKHLTVLFVFVPIPFPSIFLASATNNVLLFSILPSVAFPVLCLIFTVCSLLGVDKDKKKRLKELDAQREKERIEQEKREREGKFK